MTAGLTQTGDAGKVSHQRIVGIDTMRVVANFLVIVSHWFSWYGPVGNAAYLISYYALGALAYLPVPFFFMVSGYFIQKSLNRGKRTRAVFMTYLVRIVPIFLFWALVYAVLPYIGARTLMRGDFSVLLGQVSEIVKTFQQNPAHLLLTGHTDHLWFLVSLMIGCLWLTALKRLEKESWVMPAAVLAYAVLVATGAYARRLGIQPAPWDISRGFLAPISFMSLGYYLGKKNFSVSSRTAVLMIVGGILLKLSERFVFEAYPNDPFRHPFTMGTPVIALGAFLLALSSPRILRVESLTRFGPMTLGIYAGHLIVDHKIHALHIFRHGTWLEIFGPPTVYILTLILVTAFSRIRFLRPFVCNS